MIRVDQGEHLPGNGDAGREIDLQPDFSGVDGNQSRLQIFIQPMSQGGGRQNEAAEQQPKTSDYADHLFHHFAP